MQAANRSSKQAAKDMDDYAAFYRDVISLLAAAAPLLVPPSATSDAMATDDALAAVAARTVEALAAFAVNGHLVKAADAAVQLSFLQQLAVLVASEHVPLAVATLPAWRRLVQAFERKVNQLQGARSACAASCPHAMPGKTLSRTETRGRAGAPAEAAVDIPAECLRLLMMHCVRVLHIVNNPTESEDDVPAYVDSLTDWKEFCSVAKSGIKFVLTEAASAAPETAMQVLLRVAQDSTDAIQGVQRGTPAAAVAKAADTIDVRLPSAVDAATRTHMRCPAGHLRAARVQVLAYVLDALVPSICASSHAQACVPDLRALCTKLIALQPADAACLARVGRLLEALAPLLALVPALAPPTIEAFFALVQCMHSFRGSVPVGNSDAAPYVREQRQLTKCFTALATKAPDALVPYVDKIAQRTLELVAAQVLGDADRNMIFEGLLASAAKAGPAMYGRMATALLQQLRDGWTALLQHPRDEAWLLRTALSPVTAGPGGLVIGGNDERTRVYYTLQMIMFCARQAPSVAGGGGGEVRAFGPSLHLRQLSDAWQSVYKPVYRVLDPRTGEAACDACAARQM